jgi:hypothetical protein
MYIYEEENNGIPPPPTRISYEPNEFRTGNLRDTDVVQYCCSCLNLTLQDVLRVVRGYRYHMSGLNFGGNRFTILSKLPYKLSHTLSYTFRREWARKSHVLF